LPWCGSLTGSTGSRHDASCNRKRFCAGIGRASACFGGGSRNPAVLASPLRCKRSSDRWRAITPPGAKSGLPTNCGSSSVCGSLRELCANTCRASAWEVKASGINLNAGPRLSAIMPKASSRGISVWRSL
jgi:hypothetical protein